MVAFCSLKPPLLHLPQEFLGDGEAGGIAYYGVNIAVRTFGGGRFIGDVIRYL